MAHKTAVVGLGKMGVSHFAIANALSELDVVAVCDATSLVTSTTQKISGVKGYSDFDRMLASEVLDAIIIATPTALHEPMTEKAIDKGLHLFIEKPLTLRAETSLRLAEKAKARGLVTQVGYHNRYVGAFIEFKRLVDAGAIGKPRHFLAEAYGPVVTKPTKPTWRGKKGEGGGALLDYAAHPLNLLNWYAGPTDRCDSAIMRSIFSVGVEDEIYANLQFESGASAQLSVNWSDSSHRKMTTRITAWGEHGKIFADRQEIQLYLTGSGPIPDGFSVGWNIRYTTDLTDPVSFYLRGEEYSAQLEDFAANIDAANGSGRNSFASAALTDITIDQIDKAAGEVIPAARAEKNRRGLLARVTGRGG